MVPPPLVSVLMTVYNGERYLRSALDSILCQTYTHFELLVTDDGSQDGTWELLAGLAATDSRVRLFRNQLNLGVPRSMNSLFSLASGAYITRHDADDVSCPERFARQVDFLNDHLTIGVIGTRVQLVDAQDQPVDRTWFTPKLTNDEIQAELLRDNCLCQGSVMFRRQVLETVGGYDESSLTEDYDLWLRMAEVTQFAVLDEVLYQYRLHPASLGNRRRHEQAFFAARAIEQALHRRFGASPPPEGLESAAHHYLRAALAACQVGDTAAGREYVQHAVTIYPQLWANPPALTNEFLPQVLDTGTVGDALCQVERLFGECLPRTRSLGRLKSLWLAEIHMQVAFRDRQRMAPAEWRHHLWLGVTYRPTWLFNRGVLSLLLKPQPTQVRRI